MSPDEVDCLQITKTALPSYNQINVTIPSSSPEMSSLSPRKRDDELVLNSRQNLLAEIRNFTPKLKTSDYPSVKQSQYVISSGPCSPKNSTQIICPQNSSTTHSTLMKNFIPYNCNNNSIINETNIPDNLSFANKLNGNHGEDLYTNKNSKDGLFNGKQPVCCVCNMKITR